MTKITYDANSLKIMTLFESITKSRVKDCFIDELQNKMVFVVQPGQLWKALGAKGDNVKKLESKLNRKIKIVEFNSDKIKFIKNMIFPLKANDIKEEDDVIIINSDDTKIKGLLIGRNAANLRNLETNVQRFFKIKEIKVV